MPALADQPLTTVWRAKIHGLREDLATDVPLEIPPPATEPSDVAALTALAAEYGIEITGPPGIPG